MGSGWEKLDGGAENWRPAGVQLLPVDRMEKWVYRLGPGALYLPRYLRMA